MIVKKKCPTCNHVITGTAYTNLGSLTIARYSCGHYQSIKKLTKAHFEDFVSRDGKKPYKFQCEGAVFGIEKANGRVLILDDMGCGKTVQAIMMLVAQEPELTKFLVVCKSSIQIQWLRMITNWAGLNWPVQILYSEHDMILPGVKGYIISYDLLSFSQHIRKSKTNAIGKIVKRGIENLDTFIDKLEITTVILDEIQNIKNSEAARTQAVRQVVRKCDYLIGLSGTPIKNNEKEYFPILNMAHPERFPNMVHFDKKYLQSYWDGKVNKCCGFKDIAQFRRDTEDFIIRRTREQVLPDLPKIQRNFQYCDLGVEVEELYKQTLKQFQQYMNYGSIGATAVEKQGNILAYLNKMRHLTGLSKVNPVVDYVEDFLSETDRKLILFLHHKDVADILKERINKIAGHARVLELKSGMSNADKDNTITTFAESPEHRIIDCSTLVAGEGIDGLQKASSELLFVEREWNPSNEEQAEARLVRIGQTSNSVTGTYFVAVGTVDEFFAEKVEQKRAMLANVLDGKNIKWSEATIIQELAEVLASTGGRKWGF